MKNHEVLLMIAFYKRPEIARICLQGVKRIVQYMKEQHAIKVTPLCLVDVDDEQPAVEQSGYHIVDCLSRNAWNVGRKLNQGLAIAALLSEWTYLMQLGSDDLLSNEYLDRVAERVKANAPYFGANDIVFYEYATGNAKRYNYGDVYGAGRCIRRNLIEAHQYMIWSNDKDRALDSDSDDRMGQLGYVPQVISIDMKVPPCVDIKSITNIHKYDTLPGDEYKNIAGLLDAFPEMVDVISDRCVHGAAYDDRKGYGGVDL